jgi:hypothetical protein
MGEGMARFMLAAITVLACSGCYRARAPITHVSGPAAVGDQIHYVEVRDNQISYVVSCTTERLMQCTRQRVPTSWDGNYSRYPASGPQTGDEI